MGIYGLAWGVVIGSILNFLIQIPALLSLKGQYLPTLGLHNPAVGEVIKLMGPRIFGAAIVQLMVWVNTLLASKYEGAVYALSYGFSLMMMAQIAIAQSVATVVMPTFSTQYAQGRISEIRSTLASVVCTELILAIPASGGLIALGSPIVSFLYQRGEFTAATTQMVAWALVWYAAGLTFHSIQEVLVRAYYAMHDTKTPVVIGATAMIASIGLSILFSNLFRAWGWMPHGGLALAVSLSTALEVIALTLFMRNRLNGIEGLRIVKTAGSATLGALIMISAIFLWSHLNKTSSAAVIALGGIGMGIVLYFLVLLALRVPELTYLLDKIKARLHR
jgi:putative peptidoglycan lipid II flippase